MENNRQKPEVKPLPIIPANPPINPEISPKPDINKPEQPSPEITPRKTPEIEPVKKT